ncbi:type IV pilin protein [Solirubrobacter soli]|uniref:type IV pilin protein n=1 Tax=Solirubrobacter soli TaxID=363832 RepID=UPI000407A504|nr:type II secretion system protein [Solirubrobacter soli]
MVRSRLRADDGFTLVEMLVVTLIIGVLAAVALATFLNQRAKAQDAEAKTSTVTAAKAIEAYSTDYDGAYDGATVDELTKIEPALGKARGLAIDVNGHTFTVSVVSAASEGTVFSISRAADGLSTRDCTNPGTGGCHADLDAGGNRW